MSREEGEARKEETPPTVGGTLESPPHPPPSASDRLVTEVLPLTMLAIPVALFVAAAVVVARAVGGAAIAVPVAVAVVVGGVLLARLPVSDRFVDSVQASAEVDVSREVMRTRIRRQRRSLGVIVAAAGAAGLTLALAAL